MGAKVHGGILWRWLEELCRFKVSQINDLLQDPRKSLKVGEPAGLPRSGGVYAFWWVEGEGFKILASRKKTRTLPGPGGAGVPIEYDDEWLGLAAKLPIPLYVGKTAEDIHKRITQHLMLSESRTVLYRDKARTTTCQLRAGLDRLFPKANVLGLIRDHVAISYVKLHGPQNAANRFYLEDLAIGLMRPPLNVDIER
jgi:hypothetical protein